MESRIYRYSISSNTTVEILRFTQNERGDYVAEHNVCKRDEEGESRRKHKAIVKYDRGGDAYFLSCGSRVYLSDCRRVH